MDNETYYEILLKLLVQNIILYVADIAKILGLSLVGFTQPVGFSISAVSRLRKKVKECPESALESLTYALCMGTALDSIYLFEDIDTDDRKKIEEILLKNLCEDITLFYDKDDKPVNSCSFEFQSWFKMDYKNGKGFTYQIQFFLHEISKMKRSKEVHLIENELLQKLKEAKVAFTVTALKNCESQFDEIKKSLQTIYKKDFTNEDIYVSSLINDEIYYNNIPEEIRSCVKICKPNKELFNPDEYVPHYIRDFVEIANACSDEKNPYVLLFVQDEDHMKRYLSILNDNYKDKFIFAYNRYFGNKKCFKMVFDYKRNILVMNFDDPLSKYESLLGR